jgi:hypothetical protein
LKSKIFDGFCRVFGLKSPFVREKAENFDKIQYFLRLILDNTHWEGVEYRNVGEVCLRDLPKKRKVKKNESDEKKERKRWFWISLLWFSTTSSLTA